MGKQRSPPIQSSETVSPPLDHRDARERGPHERGERELRAWRVGALVRHGLRRIHEQPNPAVGLGLELAHEQLPVSHRGAPIQKPEIVAGDVASVTPEFHAGAPSAAPVRACVDSFGDRARAKAERR